MLDQIVATKRRELDDRLATCPREEMARRAAAAGPTRGFARALRGPTVALVAEIKPASPSAGLIRPDIEPADVARAYETGGAAALSVLTDAPFFQGSLEAMEQARAATALPVLRKDFTLDRYHVYEARATGADAILLIAAILNRTDLAALFRSARDLELDALVEVHTAREMEWAVDIGAELIGINNRNLHTFETRLETTEALAPLAPPSATLLALSGIFTRAHVERMAAAGVHAILVGESLMRSSDIACATRNLVGVPVGG